MRTTLAHRESYTSELTETAELWLQAVALRTGSPQTVSNYRTVIRGFIDSLHQQGVQTLAQVQPHHIRAYLHQLKAKGRRPHTLHKHYTVTRIYWNFCLREELVSHNPYTRVEKPKAPLQVKPTPSVEEVQRLLAACSGGDWMRKRDRALILLLISTGLRISEARSLTVQDAKQECLLITGKGSKQRAVFLLPEVRLALRQYLNACPHPLQPESPLWWGRFGPLTRDGLLEAIQKAGQRAGLKEHLGAHALRRFFATESLKAGIDLEQLRRLMGHSDFTVLRHYLHLAQEDLARAHRQYNPLHTLLRKRQ